MLVPMECLVNVGPFYQGLLSAINANQNRKVKIINSAL